MKSWSSEWKSSKTAGKQRKYRANAPLHIKRKFSGVHLSKELREKHQKRNMVIVKGDKAKVLRGQYKGQTAKVEEVDSKRSRVRLAGIEVSKKDGNKVPVYFQPSNLMITDLNMDDKKRASITQRKKPAEATKPKKSQKATE